MTKTKEQKAEFDRLNYIKNHDKKLLTSKLYRESHRDYFKRKGKEYYKKYPERALQRVIKSHKKQSKIMNMSFYKHRWAVVSWTKAVKTRDNYTCQSCGSKDNLHAHHILQKKHYPELSLNINNGITLCMTCHYEVHYWL